jgi:hypothetical protein
MVTTDNNLVVAQQNSFQLSCDNVWPDGYYAKITLPVAQHIFCLNLWITFTVEKVAQTFVLFL